MTVVVAFPPSLVTSNPAHGIPYVGLTVITTLLGTVGNALIIILFTTNKKLRRSGVEFFVNLALSDWLITTFANPFCIVGALMGEQYFVEHPGICIATAAMCTSACFCAFFSLTWVAVHRYTYVCHPILFKKIFTQKRCIAACVSVWVLAILLEIPNFMGLGGHVYDANLQHCMWDPTINTIYSTFAIVGVMAIPLVAMTAAYSSIYMAAYRARKKVSASPCNSTSAQATTDAETSNRGPPKNRPISKAPVVVYACFTIMWTPYLLLIALQSHFNFRFEVYLWISWLAHSHSAMNFIIYMSTSMSFREALGGLWKKAVFGTTKARGGDLDNGRSNVTETPGTANGHVLESMTPRDACMGNTQSTKHPFSGP